MKSFVGPASGGSPGKRGKSREGCSSPSEIRLMVNSLCDAHTIAEKKAKSVAYCGALAEINSSPNCFGLSQRQKSLHSAATLVLLHRHHQPPEPHPSAFLHPVQVSTCGEKYLKLFLILRRAQFKWQSALDGKLTAALPLRCAHKWSQGVAAGLETAVLRHCAAPQHILTGQQARARN